MNLQTKKLRQRQNLTQKELADLIGSDQRNVSNWENGSAMPDVYKLIKLSDLFNVSIEELLGLEYPAHNLLITDEKKLAEVYRTLSDEQKLMLDKFLKRLLEIDCFLKR